MTTRKILHLDLDAFFCAVEELSRPELSGQPFAVGGRPEQRGVISSCSYAARQYGIHSAMPMSQALRLCPQAVVLPVRMARYVEISNQIREVFYAYTPEIEPLSLDEAFLDMTGCISLFGSAENIGKQIKQDIKDTTGLTASVGVSFNKFLAKLASDLEKPDGFLVITNQNAQEILDPLPVSRIWGVGKVTATGLEKLGIHTVQQLRTATRYKLSMVLGNQTDDILRLAHGIDNRPVEAHAKAKSISAEETFPKDIIGKEVLAAILIHQVEEVSQRLRAEKLQCQTLTLKFRYSDFKTITRSYSMDKPTQTTTILLQEAMKIFNRWQQSSVGPLRLLGCGASGLSPEGTGQQLLFADPDNEKHKKLDAVFDKIREKYGGESLKRG